LFGRDETIRYGGFVVLLHQTILPLSGSGGGTTIVVVSNDLLTIRLALLAIAASVLLTMLNPLPKQVRWALAGVLCALVAAFAFWPIIQLAVPKLAQGVEIVVLSPWGLFEVFMVLLVLIYFSPAFPKIPKRQARSTIFPIMVETNLETWRLNRPHQLNNIVNKTFKHQEVIIDNSEYIDCTFDGVTLTYLGVGPTRIVGSVMPGFDGQPNISFKSTNSIVVATALILKGAGFISEAAARRLETKG
jgi:hypothetical protein